MSIQWFPGHMHKARKEMARVLPEIDVILELLDARLPWSSENPMLATLRGSKPVLRVLTRTDLADPTRTEAWLSSFDAAVAVRTDQPESYRQIVPRLSALVPATASRVKPRVALVVGIPNVGKSTLINHLAGRLIARTGNEPAITRQQQTVKIGEGWVLRDTPGVLWPNLANVNGGYRLAASGAVRDTAMDSSEVALWLLDMLRQDYPDALRNRFGKMLTLDSSLATLEAIGTLRGCLAGGGLIDHDRAGRLLLQEFRSGKLGGITLETPALRQIEQAETDARLLAIAEKRAARKVERKSKRTKPG